MVSAGAVLCQRGRATRWQTWPSPCATGTGHGTGLGPWSCLILSRPGWEGTGLRSPGASVTYRRSGASLRVEQPWGFCPICQGSWVARNSPEGPAACLSFPVCPGTASLPFLCVPAMRSALLWALMREVISQCVRSGIDEAPRGSSAPSPRPSPGAWVPAAGAQRGPNPTARGQTLVAASLSPRARGRARVPSPPRAGGGQRAAPTGPGPASACQRPQLQFRQ